MNKYDNGKIYKIVDDTNDNIYIGSTIEKYISRRLQGHKKTYNRYIKGNNKGGLSSIEIIKNGSYHIELIENFPCKNRMELEKRERYYIESLECVNKVIPGRTPKEYHLANKEKKILFRIENNEMLREKERNAYACNIEKSRLIGINKYKKYRERALSRAKELYEYRKTWCGNFKKNPENNLLHIDLSIF